jgi:general secretion pathway protein A
MYLTFYGLKEKPFNASPDPNFLYLTPGHREALAQLVYAVQESKGFIVLTGEVGTGKTTLLHTLIQRLDGDTEVVFIPYSKLSFDEIFVYMLEKLGITNTTNSRAQWLLALDSFLMNQRLAGQKTVLIVDEAQHLDSSTLEQIRLLSNFETPTEKPLQILLAGQPELKARLELPELHQLKQRIGLRCSIRSLTHDESRDYIRHRLRIAGAQDVDLFTDGAVKRIAGYTGGLPRLLNIVCDHCLLFGYADQKRKIDRDVVEQAIEYLKGEERPQNDNLDTSRQHTRARLRWVFGAIVTASLGGAAFRFLGSGGLIDVMHGLEGHLTALAASAQSSLHLLLGALRGILSV